MKKIFHNRHSKHNIKWLQSILSLLLPVLIVCFLLCLYSIQTTEDIVIYANQNLTASIQSNLDIRFTELGHYMEALEMTNANRELKNLEAPPDAILPQYYQLSNQIRIFSMANELVSGIYIYYPKADLVVGDLGCYRSFAYYSLMAIPERDGYSSWEKALQNAESNSLSDIPIARESCLSYIRRLYKNDVCVSMIVIEIDRTELERAMSSSYYLGDAVSSILIDSTPAVIVGNSNFSLNEEQLLQLIADRETDTNEKSGIYTYFNSSTLKQVTYVSIYSAQSLMKNMYYLLYLCVGVLIACAIACIALSVFLVRRNAKPVQQLIEKVGGSEERERIDEYLLISTKIEQMIQQKYNDEQKMVELQTKLNGLFFNTLLYGKFQNEGDIFDLAKHYGVIFEYPYYQIVVLQNAEGISFDITEDFILKNTPNLDFAECFVTICDDTYVVLLNTEEHLPYAQIEKLTKTMLDKVFPCQPAHAVVGVCCDSTLQIADIYQWLKRALSQSTPDNTHSVFNCNMTSAPHTECNTLLSAQQERQSKEPIARRAAEIIDKEFTNPTLGLYYVADKLGVSNSYLSNIFKNVYGIGIIQYTNALRIELAKELLTNTEKNIKEIASLVGFASDINFIRVFKKYENCTPSSLRKL